MLKAVLLLHGDVILRGSKKVLVNVFRSLTQGQCVHRRTNLKDSIQWDTRFWWTGLSLKETASSEPTCVFGRFFGEGSNDMKRFDGPYHTDTGTRWRAHYPKDDHFEL